MLKVKMIDSIEDEEIEKDADDEEIDTSTATPNPTLDNQNNFRRRGISGSSKFFDVEERMEDDADDLPEQGMINLIQEDLSQMMNAALAEMIARAIKRGLPADAVGDFEALIKDFRDVFRLELGLDDEEIDTTTATTNPNLDNQNYFCRRGISGSIAGVSPCRGGGTPRTDGYIAGAPI